MLALPGAHASEYRKVSSGSYNPFAQAMDMMVDAMESYGRNRAWEDALSSYGTQSQPLSWAGVTGMSPWSTMPGIGNQIPGQSQMQQLFQSYPQAGQFWQPGGRIGSPATGYRGIMPRPGAATRGLASLYGAGSAIDGVWQGNSGEIFLVHNGQFRLYAGRDNYNDGRLAVRGNRLILANPSTGISRAYEYATEDGRLVLRDDNGNLLLYRRVPRETVRTLLR
jgi:hypothetical protein